MKACFLPIFWVPLLALTMFFAVGLHGAEDAMHSEHMHQVHSELEFLVEMIPRHQEAVDSANQILTITARQEMRDFAKAVVDVQAEEIAMMRKWIEQWYPGPARQPAYQPMMRDLEGLSAEEADIVFLEDMIKHHRAAVRMAQDFLDKNLAEHDEVKTVAREIVATQTLEIEKMREWLEQWRGEAALALMIHKPEGIEAKQKYVLFLHPKHEAFECVRCHHTSEGADINQGCKDAGCHDMFVIETPEQRREIRYFEKAYHDLCIGCHRELRRQEKTTGPVDCKGCHIQE
ncbi:DUF305 domain-containing protein [Desulfonatronum sp. SC1]|uniref:DUF305 domain-containing protein n=1 Tax=Desulfonatronum sp. SC1 TaxID=2109626 RepID=UPI000D304C34|nr:DUF305 domain-containing protein [Desulfonatronum sp. SC1]PTN36333.1 hypothetical protein C6366_09715 [Desulfonatronum sp. SC1]